MSFMFSATAMQKQIEHIQTKVSETVYEKMKIMYQDLKTQLQQTEVTIKDEWTVGQRNIIIHQLKCEINSYYGDSIETDDTLLITREKLKQTLENAGLVDEFVHVTFTFSQMAHIESAARKVMNTMQEKIEWHMEQGARVPTELIFGYNEMVKVKASIYSLLTESLTVIGE